MAIYDREKKMIEYRNQKLASAKMIKKTIKHKHNGKSKTSRNRKRSVAGKARGIYGGGITNSLANFAFHEARDLQTPLSTNPIGKFFSTKSSLVAKTNPNIFRAYFNYGAPNEIQLLPKMLAAIPNSKVQMEPHLFIPDINRYIFSLTELAPFSRLIWLVVFNARSKEHTFLSYLPPLITTPNGVHNYILQAYKYPKSDLIPEYSTVDTPLSGRQEELQKFKTYLATNSKVMGIPIFIRSFLVKYDSGNAMSFLLDMDKKKKN